MIKRKKVDGHQRRIFPFMYLKIALWPQNCLSFAIKSISSPCASHVSYSRRPNLVTRFGNAQLYATPYVSGHFILGCLSLMPAAKSSEAFLTALFVLLFPPRSPEAWFSHNSTNNQKENPGGTGGDCTRVSAVVFASVWHDPILTIPSVLACDLLWRR